MPLLDECERLFATRDLYAVLGLPRTCDVSDVKRAYRRLALVHHPDKAHHSANPADSHDRFHTIGRICELLTDDDTRKAYDETGAIDDDPEAKLPKDRDWETYWRALYVKVDTELLASFTAAYRGSAEESADLRAAFVAAEGDMDVSVSFVTVTPTSDENFSRVFDNVMCSNPLDDEDRFRSLIDQWVAAQEVPPFPGQEVGF